MKSGWQNFESRFSALSQREKVLITLCGSVLIVMMLLLGLIEPALKQGQARQLQMQTLTSSNLQLQGEIMALQGAVGEKSRPRVGCGAEPTDVAKSGNFRAAGGQNDLDGCSIRDA